MSTAALFLLIQLSICCVVRVPAEQLARPSIENARSMAHGTAAGADLWCVAKNNAEDAALQAALDWACGLGGADCRPIQQGGACFSPDDLQFHASYAFNDYYLRNGASQQACDFGGSAALTILDPGNANCRFPSRSSPRNESFVSSTGSPTGGDISGGGIGRGFPLSPAFYAAFSLFFI